VRPNEDTHTKQSMERVDTDIEGELMEGNLNG
jgi:hypothetical protein